MTMQGCQACSASPLGSLSHSPSYFEQSTQTQGLPASILQRWPLLPHKKYGLQMIEDKL